MLFIMLAYLMLFAALFNAICLYNAFIMPLTFSNAFCFHSLSWVNDTLFNYFKYYFRIMHIAFNLLVFLILCSHQFFLNERAMCSLDK